MKNNISGLKFLVKKVKLLFFTVAFLFLFYSLAPAQDYGDAYVSGSIADARTLLPILASDTASADICSMIFNGLVKYDKDINIIADLALSWEIKDEGLTIIFHLKKNVFWQDGAPFTSRDVEFTFRKLVDPNVKTPYSSDFERVKLFEIIDDYTFKVEYKEPFAPALSSWGMSIMPRHLLDRQDLNVSGFQRKPVGTGPYKFKTWKTQEKIELVSNRGYFEKRPFIDRYISRVIPDESTIFLELQTQGLDSAGLTPLQYKRQTDTGFFKTHYQKFRLPSFGYTYLGYNLSRDLFKDKRVRQALNYAVNKQEIIDMVLLGLGRLSNGLFVPESWAYDKNTAPYPFDPLKAKELLRSAGWVDNNHDGWLENNKRVFEFTIITNQGNEERIKTAQIIQRRLKEIGIKIKIKVVEWSVFLAEFIEKKDFDAILLGWSVSRDPDSYDIWHSSKTKPGEFNFVGFKNEEVDRLLLQARRTFDQEKRKSCYQRINRIIYEEQPYMFLYVPDSLFVLHQRFQGLEPAAIGIGYNFIDWWVPGNRQMYNRVEK